VKRLADALASKKHDFRFHLAPLMGLLVKADFPVRLDLRRHQFTFGTEMEAGIPVSTIAYPAVFYGFRKSLWLAPASTCCLLQSMGWYWTLAQGKIWSP